MTEIRAQLQKPLQGLARFLGLQSQGSLQVNWTPNLVPVYDLGEWIGPPQVNQARSATVALDGTFTAFTVPDGETWKIFNIQVMVKSFAYTDSYLRMVRNGQTHGQVLAPTETHVSEIVNLSYMHPPGVECGYAIYPANFWVEGGDAIEVKLQRGSAPGNNEVRVAWQYQNRTL